MASNTDSFSREQIPSWWGEHSKSVQQMSQDELHQIARKAVALFRRVAGTSNEQSWNELGADIAGAQPEVNYLFHRMTAGDRLSGPLNEEESDEAYGQRARAIAMGIAARYSGYELTPEDWPLP